MKQSLSLLMLLGCMLNLNAQIRFEEEQWTRVQKQAKKESKVIFVDAYTTWCGPCKWMAKNVFTDPSVGEFYNANFVNLKLDMEKGEGLAFAEQYEVNAYPTLLFLDGDGNLLHKHLGAIPAEEFLRVGKDALSPDQRIGTLMSEYKTKKKDKEFLQMYIPKMLSAGIAVDEAAHTYFALLEDDELVTQDNLMILQMWFPSSDTEAFQQLYKNRQAFGALSEQAQVDAMIEGILTNDIHRAIKSGDPAALSTVQTRIGGMDLPYKEKLLVQADMLNAQAQGNTDAYLKYAAKYTKDFHWNDWNVLNNTAWDMYLDESLDTPAEMKLAVKLAKQAVKVEQNYYTTDTYASTLYKSGKNKAALKWANIAIDLAKKSGDDYTITAELQEKIKAEMQ